MKDRDKLRGEIIDILQDTDWSDQGIENMADKIIALRDDVGQRELLLAFAGWLYGNLDKEVEERIVDDYLNSK